MGPVEGGCLARAAGGKEMLKGVDEELGEKEYELGWDEKEEGGKKKESRIEGKKE